MRVASLTAYHVRIPLRRTVRHASHVRSSTDNVLVRCELADGTTGWGEGVPRDYVTGETIDSSLALLQSTQWGDQLVECVNFPAAVAMAERLRLPDVPGDDRGIVGNAARCAAEVAFLDALGRHFGRPLTEVTRILTPDLFCPQARVQYSGAITASDGFKLRLVALLYRLYGFSQVKVKVGIKGQDDVRRLAAVRRRVGRSVRLRVDANEAWSPDTVTERIRELEPFGIESIEQPVPHADVDALRQIREAIRTPIMLDESLCGMNDARRVVNDKLCDRFNLRLSKCGGFTRSLRLAEFAKRSGIGCQLGCQVGETAILSAAGRHFASSAGGLTALEGSFDRRLVREPLSTRDITFGRGGWANALPGPGLGIEIDRAAVDRVCIRQEQIFG